MITDLLAYTSFGTTISVAEGLIFLGLLILATLIWTCGYIAGTGAPKS